LTGEAVMGAVDQVPRRKRLLELERVSRNMLRMLQLLRGPE